MNSATEDPDLFVLKGSINLAVKKISGRRESQIIIIYPKKRIQSLYSKCPRREVFPYVERPEKLSSRNLPNDKPRPALDIITRLVGLGLTCPCPWVAQRAHIQISPSASPGRRFSGGILLIMTVRFPLWWV